jgi:hypothetical protein
MHSLKNEVGEPAKISTSEIAAEPETEKETELIATGIKVKNNV